MVIDFRLKAEVNTLSNAVLESKKAVVSEIKEKFENSTSAVIVEYSGMFQKLQIYVVNYTQKTLNLKFTKIQ